MPTILDCAGFGDVEIANSPGRSFARQLREEALEGWGDEVYFEQEESRGIRTHKFAYWKRLQGFGPAELFDVENDPGQNRNLFGQPGYDDVVRELDQKLTAFFERYTDPKYDLWKGGKTKSFTGRTAIVNKMTKIGWAQDSTIRPLFKDTK